MDMLARKYKVISVETLLSEGTVKSHNLSGKNEGGRELVQRVTMTDHCNNHIHVNDIIALYLTLTREQEEY
jgi:hypothetical protein